MADIPFDEELIEILPDPPDGRKRRILFVDDLQTVLIGLQRLLKIHASEWEMAFVHSGAEALALLEKETFDIIVSDVVMPQMNGVELLEIVKERYPTMIRFILSGYGDHQTLIQSAGATHQFMTKPCDRNILVGAISRALSLRNLFKNKELLTIVKDATSIPTLPELIQELTSELASTSGSSESIATIISKDAAISAKVLQLANSAYFGLSRKIRSISEAVTLLGADTIHSIVLTTSVFSQFDEAKIARFNIRDIFGHSVRTGALARKLAKEFNLNKRGVEESLLSGMLHDLGKLVLIDSDNEAWAELYTNRKPDEPPMHILEREQLGVTHAEIGAYLLGVWGISNTVVEAVAFHHKPFAAPSKDIGALTTAHLADAVDNQANHPERQVEPDMYYLSEHGLETTCQELLLDASNEA